MPYLKPQTRFFLRGTVLLIGFLLAWWVVLQEPLLALLREATAISGSVVYGISAYDFVSDGPAGAWSFQVPRTLRVAGPPGTELRSLSFDVSRGDVVSFTFSLPVYWAVMLAAPGVRRCLRPLAAGSVILVAVETVLLLAFVEITTRHVAAQLTGSHDGLGEWALRCANYLVVNALPYASPFLLALWLHGELRRGMLVASD